jgi:uncharacterized protein (AIM24 family)
MAAPTAEATPDQLRHMDREWLPSMAQSVQPGAAVGLTKIAAMAPTGRWTLQNPRLVSVQLGADAMALRGAMVAYKGNVDFDFKSRGIRGVVEDRLMGQSIKLMICKGQGEVFLAHEALDLHVLELEANQKLCVSSRNLLAMDATITHEVKRIESAGIPGGGIFHFEITGPGTVVVMTRGIPMMMQVSGPTFVDINAIVAWTVGQRVSVASPVRVRRQVFYQPSGEPFNMQFQAMGTGHFVIVQPYEV